VAGNPAESLAITSVTKNGLPPVWRWSSEASIVCPPTSARTAFSVNMTEGPTPSALKSPENDDPNAALATDIAGA